MRRWPPGDTGSRVALGIGYLIVVAVHTTLFYRVNHNIVRVSPFNISSALLVIDVQVDSVDGLNQILYDRHEELNSVYLQRQDEFQRLRERSSDLLTDERAYLGDSVKRVGLLGAKLDYELHVLESKVEDMEDGLSDFERHIVNVETRIKGLVKNEQQHSGSSWITWLGRSIGLNMQ